MTPRLAVGGEVWPEEWPRLAKEGLRATIDCREEGCDDAGALAELGIAHLHLPTADHHAPAPEALDAAVAFSDAASGPVLVHCREGVGRSVVVALCCLVQEGTDPLAALCMAKDARWQVSPAPRQYEAWADWLRRRRLAPPPFDAFAGIAYRHLR